MSHNYWGRYRDVQPQTHYDPLQTFLVDDNPIGFRVNFMPGRRHRPREQHIPFSSNFDENKISEEEIEASPLYKVLVGREACIPIAGDDQVLSEPNGEAVYQDLRSYDGIAIINKYSPLGLYSEEATGVAMVNYPTTYTRSLSSTNLNLALLRPMRTSLKHLLEGNTYRDDLKTPLCFFNIGPSSGSSIKYLHSQSYALLNAGGMNTYAFTEAYNQNENCLTCKIASDQVVRDHLGQEINYEELTIWENSLCRVIIPYAPLRTTGTRIIPKDHVDYIGNASDRLLSDLAEALKMADYMMNASAPSGRTVLRDRTIPFRQTSKIGKDFHMFLDLLPPFPFVAAEAADFLGMSPYRPEKVAKRMRELATEYKN